MWIKVTEDNMGNIVKSKLIKNVTEKVPALSEKDVELSVNILLDSIADALAKGDRIEIRGFGSFSLHYRAPRKAHNPKTGEKIITEPKYSPHFKPGKELRERVNASMLQAG